MKKGMKIIGMLLMTLALVVSINSCKKDKSSVNTKSYLQVDGAAFVSGSFPKASASDSKPVIDDVAGNSSVIAGGSNPVTISSSSNVSKIVVGVEGASGYYQYDATGKSANTLYLISIVLSSNISPNSSFIIIIALVDPDGLVSETYELPVSIVAAGTGVLQVSLSWNQPNDLDLHLVEPNGEEIYYINDISANGGELDLDSNPGCYIDGVQNENITYSSSATVETGTYTVRVDLYSACDVTAATNYIVTARLNGNLISATSSNPFNGTFPANSIGDYGSSGAGVQVMQFSISSSDLKSANISTFNTIKFPNNRVPASVTGKAGRMK